MNHGHLTDANDKVADALMHSWVYYLPRWVWPFAQLARWERPIGWQLLMWPCLWSSALAVLAAQNPEATSVAVIAGAGKFVSSVAINAQKLVPFTITVLLPLVLGAFLMRGAGCTYNDLADVDIDDKVERTRSRPLPSGRVSKTQAIAFMIAQSLGGFCVLLYLSRVNSGVFWLGVASLILVAIYPFMKRITWWPQLFLGLAFSWGALIGWTVIWRELTMVPVLLYVGSIFWVIGYDTIYAHQDREDDALIGVKSTARLFGEKTRLIVGLLYLCAVCSFVAAYWSAIPLSSGQWAWPAWGSLLIGAGHLTRQIALLDTNDGDACLRLFKSNSTFGAILFSGLILSLLIV